MVPIVNRPMMEHIVRVLARAGVRDVIATLHPMPEQVQEHFADGSRWGVMMRYLVEEKPLGTAGSVAKARELLDGTVVVMSGDALTDLELARVLDFHVRRGAAATLVLRAVPDPSEYGMVITDQEGRIQRFLEKPARGQVFSDHVNTGIYVLESHILERVPQDQPFDFSKDLFPALLADGEPLYGWVTDAYWSDIGTPEQYRQAHLDVLDGQVALDGAPGWMGREIAPGVWVGDGVRVAPGARLEPPVVLGPGCEVMEDAVVGPFVSMGEGCWVDRGASIRRSVAWNGCRLGQGAEVRGAILGDAVTLGRRARVFEGAVLGPRVRVGEAAEIAPGVRVWPEKPVDPYRTIVRHLVWMGSVSRATVSVLGISGVAGVELTPEVAAGVGGAFASTLQEPRRVMVAHSGDAAGRALALATGSGAASAGAEVVMAGPLAAPALRELLRSATGDEQTQVRGAIYVVVERETGVARLRLWDEHGDFLSPDRARAIDHAFRRDEWRRVGAGAIREVRVDEAVPARAREAYLRALEARLGRMEAWRGSGGDGARAARDGLACVGIVFDGAEERGHAHPGRALLSAALHRCGFQPAGVRGRGAGGAPGLLWPDSMVAAVRIDASGEHATIWERDGRRVRDPVLHALQVIGQDGAAPVSVPVDASDLAWQVLEADGHRVRAADGTAWAGDGIWVACAAAVLARRFGSIEAALRGPEEIPTRLEMALPVEWERMGQVMRLLAREAAGLVEPPVDGLKVRHPQGWALVRPDVEHPLVRLHVEASTIEDARDLLARYADYVRRAASRSV